MEHRIRLSLSILILFMTMIACGPGQNPTPTGSVPITPAVSQPQATPPPPDGVINPDDLEYLGAFRLPGGEDPPRTFAYGGNAMTFNPDGDPAGAADSYSGSLFVMVHDRIAYGGVPDGNQVAEVSIPVPVISRNIEDLSTAEFIQDFADVTKGHFTDL